MGSYDFSTLMTSNDISGALVCSQDVSKAFKSFQEFPRAGVNSRELFMVMVTKVNTVKIMLGTKKLENKIRAHSLRAFERDFPGSATPSSCLGVHLPE